MSDSVVKVIKRDGKIEDFNEDKLKRIAVTTGISEEKAEEIAAKIRTWAQEKKEVRSTEIREFFSNELRHIRPYSADLYDWYQKIKIKNLETKYDTKTA